MVECDDALFLHTWNSLQLGRMCIYRQEAATFMVRKVEEVNKKIFLAHVAALKKLRS